MIGQQRNHHRTIPANNVVRIPMTPMLIYMWNELSFKYMRLKISMQFLVPFPACTSAPCYHNGTCIDGITHPDFNFDETGYHCLCSPGFEGKNCESKCKMCSLIRYSHFEKYCH